MFISKILKKNKYLSFVKNKYFHFENDYYSISEKNKISNDSVYLSKEILAIIDGSSRLKNKNPELKPFSKAITENITILHEGEKKIYYENNPKNLIIDSINLAKQNLNTGNCTFSIMSIPKDEENLIKCCYIGNL